MIVINESTIAAQTTDTGVARQRLFTEERVKGARVAIDRITMAAGATIRFDLSAKSIAWLQLLDGGATFKSYYTDRLTNVHSVVLPPRINATLSSDQGATLLYVEIPDAARCDPGFASNSPLFVVVEWTREPVFACETDARKRVALVTQDIGSTAALKAEMVIFPPGGMAPSCHHEGAATLMYMLSGRGTASTIAQSAPVRPGDLIYFPDREQHALKAADDGEMRFLEFHVPGVFKTIWADPSKASAWMSTDRDINGFETLEDQKLRKSFRFVFPFANP